MNNTVANIVNASRTRLLCIVYEELLNEILEFSKEYDSKHKNKCIDILNELVSCLDFDYELSHDLFKLYVYVQRLIINNGNMDETYKLIHTIYEGYKHLDETIEDHQCVMDNTEKVYVGLTYGKNSLNESTLNSSRGFRV